MLERTDAITNEVVKPNYVHSGILHCIWNEAVVVRQVWLKFPMAQNALSR